MWITWKKEERTDVLHRVEKIYFCQILSTKIFFVYGIIFPNLILKSKLCWNHNHSHMEFMPPKDRRDQEDPGPNLRRKKLV